MCNRPRFVIDLTFRLQSLFRALSVFQNL